MKFYILFFSLFISCSPSIVLIKNPEYGNIGVFIRGFHVFVNDSCMGFFDIEDFPIPLKIKKNKLSIVVLKPVFEAGGCGFEGVYPAACMFPLDSADFGSVTQVSASWGRGIFGLLFLKPDNLKILNYDKIISTALNVTDGNPFLLDFERLERDLKSGVLNRYSFGVRESCLVEAPVDGLDYYSENPFRKVSSEGLRIYKGLERFIGTGPDNEIRVFSFYYDGKNQPYWIEYEN
jgi:hypothetical protein